jgi:uncharacterized protein YneF (UPF0154 family)
MAKDGSDSGFSWWRHPVRAVRAWLEQPERTRGESLLVGVLGTLLVMAVSGILAVLLAAITIVDFGGEAPLWMVVAAAIVAFGLGAAIGAFVVRRLYHAPRLNAAEKRFTSSESGRAAAEERLLENEAQLREAEDKIETVQKEVADLEPHRDIRLRIESYAEQIRLLLSRGLGTGLEDVEEELLAEPAKLINKMTGVEVRLSVWKPERLDDGQEGWRISHGPDHTDRECSAFSVPLDSSWIAYTQKQRRDDAVFGLSDLASRADVTGDDLSSFRKAGFRSLLCSRVATGPLTGHLRKKENTACLVALSRQPKAFSTVESRYLQFLGRLLSLHFQITELIEQVDRGGESTSAG